MSLGPNTELPSRLGWQQASCWSTSWAGGRGQAEGTPPSASRSTLTTPHQVAPRGSRMLTCPRLRID